MMCLVFLLLLFWLHEVENSRLANAILRRFPGDIGKTARWEHAKRKNSYPGLGPAGTNGLTSSDSSDDSSEEKRKKHAKKGFAIFPCIGGSRGARGH